MNHAYVRIGGVLMDLPDGGMERIGDFLQMMPGRIDEYERLLTKNPIWLQRNSGVGPLSAEDALALGVTGPMLRAAGVARDVRRDEPYCGYETYGFDVVTRDGADCYARYLVRIEEMRQSLRIVGQCLDRLREPGPVMVDDPKVRWPAQLEVGPDGIGNSQAYITHIMEESMEALIHHFKMVTEGVSVPPGEVYVPVESPARRARLLRRLRRRQPSLPREDARPVVRQPQAAPQMIRGGLVADVIAVIASIDPVLGGVDR